MRSWLVFLLLLLALPLAADVKLYLKEGGFHLVREYEVKPDRVRFFSTERGEWEEIPLELVDLKKTACEVERKTKAAAAQKEADRAERDAERQRRREIASVPDEPGVYWIDGANLVALKAAEVKVVTNKRRSILKAMSPIPIVSGKATLEVEGAKSARELAPDRPEFYFRISQPERFTIVRCTPGKGKEVSRIVQTWTLVPVTKEIVQEHVEVPVFRHQVGDDLYKVWPQKTLAPGEYAFIQYTEGKGNVQVWDFTVVAARQ